MIKYANPIQPSDRKRNLYGISTTEASERFLENAADAFVQRKNGPAALLYRNIARQNSLAAQTGDASILFRIQGDMINVSHLKVLRKVDDLQSLMHTFASINRIDSLFCTRDAGMNTDTPPQLRVNDLQNSQPLMQPLASGSINISNVQGNFTRSEGPIDSLTDTPPQLRVKDL